VTKRLNIFVAFPDNEFRRTFFTDKVKERLNGMAEISWNPSAAMLTREQLEAGLAEADICLSGWSTPQIEREMLKHSPMKLICNIGNLKGSIHRGIFETEVKISSSQGGFTQSVAEACLMLLLMSFRNTFRYMQMLKTNTYRWREDREPGRSIHGKTIGVLGYGTIAKELIRLLRLFEADIVVCDDYCSEEEGRREGFRVMALEPFLQTCDAVCIHHTLTANTYHLLDRPRLRMMKDDAIIVNTARGAIIDEQALIAELKQGRLFAAMDVYEQEPIAPDSPLRSLPNTIITPHISGFTYECRQGMVDAAVEDIRRFIQGEGLLCQIDVGKYDRATDMSTAH
jgi:phosphoglycerate dehydrogenase-like enzyme